MRVSIIKVFYMTMHSTQEFGLRASEHTPPPLLPPSKNTKKPRRKKIIKIRAES